VIETPPADYHNICRTLPTLLSILLSFELPHIMHSALRTRLQATFFVATIVLVVITTAGLTLQPSYSFSVLGRSSLSYHARLATVRPLDTAPHSPTLGASKIYVISLKTREDRREKMEQMRQALRLEWDYLDATPKNDQSLSRISERVRDTRERYFNKNTRFAWPPDTDGRSAALNGSDFWMLPPTDPRSSDAQHPLPPPPNPDTRPNLYCDAREMEIPQENRRLPLNEGRLACWSSHVTAISKLAIELPPKGYGVILEDDIDFEWDIDQKMAMFVNALPEDWDMLLLGET